RRAQLPPSRRTEPKTEGQEPAAMHELLKRPLDRASTAPGVNAEPSEADLLALEEGYCSHGDTVHYTNPPKILAAGEGSFLYDAQGRPYLDLQMWYSAVNLAYRNARLT